MYSKKDILTYADGITKNIEKLDIIQTYKRVEQQIHQNKTIATKMNQLKKQQKQSVNFQNYGKQHAFEQSEDEINHLEAEINHLPIVDEFKSAQFEANEFLQLMISTMENRLNEHHTDEHSNQ